MKTTVIRGNFGLYYVRKASGRYPWVVERRNGPARRTEVVARRLPTKTMAVAVAEDCVKQETEGPLA